MTDHLQWSSACKVFPSIPFPPSTSSLQSGNETTLEVGSCSCSLGTYNTLTR